MCGLRKNCSTGHAGNRHPREHGIASPPQRAQQRATSGIRASAASQPRNGSAAISVRHPREHGIASPAPASVEISVRHPRERGIASPRNGAQQRSASERTRVGGADGDRDEQQAHEQSPHRHPVRPWTDALDRPARRAAAIDLDAGHGGSRDGAAPDLDRATNGHRAVAGVLTQSRRGDGDVGAGAAASGEILGRAAWGAVCRGATASRGDVAVVKAWRGAILGAAARGADLRLDVAARHGAIFGAAARRADLRLDLAALARRAAGGEIGLVSAAASLVGALDGIPEMLYIGPPSAGIRLCHVG